MIYLKSKKGTITVNKIRIDIWTTSWSRKKLTGCKRILVVGEKRSTVTRITDKEESVKMRFRVFILPLCGHPF